MGGDRQQRRVVLLRCQPAHGEHHGLICEPELAAYVGRGGTAPGHRRRGHGRQLGVAGTKALRQLHEVAGGSQGQVFAPGDQPLPHPHHDASWPRSAHRVVPGDHQRPQARPIPQRGHARLIPVRVNHVAAPERDHLSHDGRRREVEVLRRPRRRTHDHLVPGTHAARHERRNVLPDPAPRLREQQPDTHRFSSAGRRRNRARASGWSRAIATTAYTITTARPERTANTTAVPGPAPPAGRAASQPAAPASTAPTNAASVARPYPASTSGPTSRRSTPSNTAAPTTMPTDIAAASAGTASHRLVSTTPASATSTHAADVTIATSRPQCRA